MTEQWKPVVGYEDTHLVSNLGRVYSKLSDKILSPYISNKGYYMVMLNHGGKDRHGKTIHRLVAEAFLDKPDNCNIINHKDENKLNNIADNLEWCTSFYNNQFSGIYEKAKIANSKAVYQYDKSFNLVATYSSTRDASKETGFSYGNIANACHNPELIRYGFHWSYEPIVKKVG